MGDGERASLLYVVLWEGWEVRDGERRDCCMQVEVDKWRSERWDRDPVANLGGEWDSDRGRGD